MSDQTAPSATEVEIASHIGPDRYWRLKVWASATAKALGCETAVLHGSALHGKDWRDLDVRFTFSDFMWSNRVGHAFTGDSWWALCAGLSAHGSSVVGAPVDAQVTTLPDAHYLLWAAAA